MCKGKICVYSGHLSATTRYYFISAILLIVLYLELDMSFYHMVMIFLFSLPTVAMDNLPENLKNLSIRDSVRQLARRPTLEKIPPEIKEIVSLAKQLNRLWVEIKKNFSSSQIKQLEQEIRADYLDTHVKLLIAFAEKHPQAQKLKLQKTGKIKSEYDLEFYQFKLAPFLAGNEQEQLNRDIEKELLKQKVKRLEEEVTNILTKLKKQLVMLRQEVKLYFPKNEAAQFSKKVQTIEKLAVEDQIDPLKEILTKYGKINLRKQVKLLRTAIIIKNYKAIKFLLENNDVLANLPSEGPQCPLALGIETNDLAIMELLLKHDACILSRCKVKNPTEPDSIDQSCLAYAYEKNHWEIAEFLSNKGAGFFIEELPQYEEHHSRCQESIKQYREELFEQFWVAIKNEDYLAIEFLLENNDVFANLPSEGPEYPLALAIETNNLAIMELMLKHGASPRARCKIKMPTEPDSINQSCLASAYEKNHLGIAEYLMHHGAKLLNEELPVYKKCRRRHRQDIKKREEGQELLYLDVLQQVLEQGV